MAVLAFSRTSVRLAGSCVGPLNEMVITCRPRFETSFSIGLGVML